MAEDVRIAMTERTLLNWPQRCPRCGSTSALVKRDALLLRMIRRRSRRESALDHFLLGDVNFGAASDNLRIPILTCWAHARSNQIGGSFLRHDVMGSFLRQSIYVGAACLVLFVVACLRSGASLEAEFASLPSGMRAYAAWSIVGVAALAWARHVAWVRPIRLDENFQTATVRFRDAAYAREFKAMNPEATMNPPVSGFFASLRVTPSNALALLALGLLGIILFFRFVSP
jgi:hypothetical protein